MWNDEIIALKQLTLDTGSTAEALGFEFEDAVDPLAVFAEFRREILLMRCGFLPNHPNHQHRSIALTLAYMDIHSLTHSLTSSLQ